jgi:transcriptional regulator with XRE-family HTH domain
MTDTGHPSMAQTSRIVAANILAQRKSRGWTVRVMSEKLAQAGRPLLASGVTKIELGSRRVDVDDLVAFSAAFGVDPASMLARPGCATCNGAPPVGFTCNECGTAAGCSV